MHQNDDVLRAKELFQPKDPIHVSVLAATETTSTTETPLEPLPHRVYFLNRDRERWGDLIGNLNPPPVETFSDRQVIAKDIWMVQTYSQLRRRGLDVQLVDKIVPDAINVVTYDDLIAKELPWNSYMVTCRHDRGRPIICEQRIVQNKCNIVDETDHYMPHWPQPGIIRRDESRGDRVETAVYLGSKLYMRGPLGDPSLPGRLKEIGVTFTPRFGDVESKKTDWTDHRDVDVIIAIRDCTIYDANNKPPSKLINAWLAGCPAVLGPESAFQQLRESELDYLEVRTLDDIVNAVAKLKNDPALYRAMRENGLRRGADFTAERTARRWRDLLAGPIAQGFERWRRAPMRMITRPLTFAMRLPAHRRERKRYRHEIHHGPRLLSA